MTEKFSTLTNGNRGLQAIYVTNADSVDLSVGAVTEANQENDYAYPRCILSITTTEVIDKYYANNINIIYYKWNLKKFGAKVIYDICRV